MKDVRKDKGFGYKTDNGLVCMQRCFTCGRENWAPIVSSGQCAWCGYNPNDKEVKDEDR